MKRSPCLLDKNLTATIRQIWAIVLCLFRHQGRILVADGIDPVKQEAFGRPLGGGIEFGETSRGALIREIREELGAEMMNIQFLGVLESIFSYNGNPGHELVFVYDAQFVDASLYDRTQLEVQDDHGQFVARWRSLAEMTTLGQRLVPDGIAALL